LVWGGKFGTHAGKNQKRKTKSNLKWPFPRFSETAFINGHVMAVWPIKCLGFFVI
jgi:hypothetical protein